MDDFVLSRQKWLWKAFDPSWKFRADLTSILKRQSYLKAVQFILQRLSSQNQENQANIESEEDFEQTLRLCVC